MGTLQDFHTLVTHMLSGENETRNIAEKQYDQIPNTTKGQLLFHLFLDHSASTEVNLLMDSGGKEPSSEMHGFG